jgi:AhpD family alkylhydroperoxidase
MLEMANLRRFKKLEEHAPEAFKAFEAFDKATFEASELSVQVKQLIALAAALTTQCPYCIELHTAAVRDAGATDTQLTEAAMVAAPMRAGAAIAHTTHLMRD